MTERYLTTMGVAQLAGVAPSSVKRWADEELLPCNRTAGGHRRFLHGDVVRWLAHLESPPGGSQGTGAQAERWLALILDKEPYALVGGLFSARGRLGAWHRVADELGAALGLLGAKWQRGEISILEEHLASERLERSLEQVLPRGGAAASAPVCLLATLENEDHTLGLSLAELCLREAGWTAAWSGRQTPLNDLLHDVEKGELAMVALSASKASPEPEKLAAAARKLASTCARRGIHLVLGGGGPWPVKLKGALRLHSYGGFDAILSATRKGRSA